MAREPTPPAVGVCESEPTRVLPGLAKFSKVQLVADARACRRKNDAVLGSDGAQIGVIVGVAKTHLQGVVIYVRDA